MKRLHVHIKVKDIEESTKFYAALFGREPDKREPDYAKWMLDDPHANISISARKAPLACGVDHVGVQVENDEALSEIAARVKRATGDIVEEADAACCYARSNKYWTKGPEGVVWELFHTFGDSASFGATRPSIEAPKTTACCGPA